MRKRILVVDDEAARREMMTAIIGCLPGGSDLDVFDYDNADSAIEAIRASEIPFDLVISDLQIPVNLLG
ncbi:MAG: hypothetical protein KGJ33_02310, partial [Patescibacteria group bacterium]|nr:hypothetical protein [Patescibacteria group bacterium]